jgi:rod shape-determining protein MreC
VNNHKHVLILKVPESPANNPMAESRPMLQRNNAQHLDQSVVDVLQKSNAQVDPNPVTTPPVLDAAQPETNNPAPANSATPVESVAPTTAPNTPERR